MELGPTKQKTCQDIQAIFFAKGSREKSSLFKPQQVGAPAEKIDKKIQYVVFNDPNLFPAVAYCYFVFRGWLNPAEITPDVFASRASGFSILHENLAGYKKWIDQDPQGKSCKKLIEEQMQENIFDLQASLSGYAAFIGINPYASVKNHGSNLSAVKEDFKLTVVHERIHAYQVQCKSLDEWGQHEWQKAPAETKNLFKEKYPSYNWDDPKVAAREFVAFSYENNPQDLKKHLGNCSY